MDPERIHTTFASTSTQLDSAFEFFFSQLTDAVFVVDSGGMIHRSNETFVRLFQHDATGMTSCHYSDLSLFEKKAEFERIVTRVMEEGGVRSEEIYTRDATGKVHRCLASGSLYREEGEERILFILRSLDEIEALQEQLYQAQKMEEVGRLTGAVAHDLNNILTVILGNISYAELLTSSNLATIEDLVRIREEVKLATERAVGVTGQLLAFSRKQFMEVKTVDVKALLEEAARMITHLTPENISFDLEMTNEQLKNVDADPMLLQQVLLNLSVNAVHAMPMGGNLRMRVDRTIGSEDFECTICHDVLSGEFIVIEVQDEGIGIPRELLSKIFEPFFTTKEAGKGTGLGLSTVANIVLRHRGHIHVESVPGAGSTFSVYLPTVEGEAVEVRRPTHPGDELPTGSERVIVVDDDINIRRLIANLLRNRGYEVDTFADGNEVIKLCGMEECSYDLLITDIMMPDINGLEIASRVHEIKPEMKILCISGYIESTALMEEVERSRYPLLAKPFNSMQLLLKVREVLETRAV